MKEVDIIINKNSNDIINNNEYYVTKEYMDDYIEDIKYRVLQGMLPPEDIKIVERYEEYKNHERNFKKIDFDKLMYRLMEE